ncbi:universal stress protein A-like protein isoform X1 [Brassica rapa]|uniref:universal stress protein A-like protein isoform X1 n=1 Tax=Brassica campestris TaxID=3711 RepID=UPI0004F15B97|nr:universal stress protein A-like protein isoform X1 [Brassica rapa]
MEREPTRVMVAVNESTIKGKPHPSISSKRAFEWTLEKMIRSNTSDFKILLLHVHVVDEDGFDEVSCEAWIKKGDPKDVICQEVSRVRPDLLVLGSRGLGRFQKVFVGTVSGFCVKHAECPVLTIKRNADETPSDLADD